ncbi:MAG: hypothetical protein KC877_00215 [Candidatus Kaiserbacteria bacterium]|nr:hypothetical protein [Candidatus Kaiserbacteria bacterium]MCB9815857.1 hypothetical protein [Candidatus Nomurabacteria bacterium]
MEPHWQIIVFSLLVVDSVGAIIMSWCGRRWWIHNLGVFAEYFPPAKGWSALYFLLVLVIGHLLGLY